MNKSFIRCIVLSICICFLHYQCVFAVSCIDHLGVADGLSHYSINEFYQDEYERMWVGTRHGLNCISGSDCRIIQSDSTNTYLTTISDIFVEMVKAASYCNVLPPLCSWTY